MLWKRLKKLFPFLKKAAHFVRTTKALSAYRLEEAIEVEKVTDGSIENLKILWSSEKISFESNDLDRRFLEVAKCYNEGFYQRRTIFTCEVPGAWVHVPTGLTCTPDFKAIVDSNSDRRRLETNWQFGRFKPFATQRRRLPSSRPGSRYAVITDTWAFNWGHWISDNLPRIYSISRAYPNDRIILLSPAGFKQDWKDSLAASLPPQFEILEIPGEVWVQADRLVLPSHVSGRANYHLPPGYYESMQRLAFKHLGLPPKTEPSERLYVSRKNGKSRRALNEKEVVKFLDRYGFKSVLPEKMSFREQVDLYRRAEVVIGVHGANWGLNVYSGRIKNLVLSPQRHPETYVFTFCKCVGQEHHYLAGEGNDDNADFSVDLKAMQRVLEDEMQLRPRQRRI